MRITKIEILPVNIGMSQEYLSGGLKSARGGTWSVCKYVIIKMYTNEGIIGIGEVPPLMRCSREGQCTVVATIKNYLAPTIIGRDPFNIEEIWKEMDKAVTGHQVAKSALDIALYDIMGKALNVPIYKLIGGLSREEIPLTGIVGHDESISKMVKMGEKWLSQGYDTIRYKIGKGLKKDEELIKAVRAGLGERVKIRVDANQAYSSHEAVKIAKTLEKYDLESFEQPVPWFDVKGLSFVNKSCHTPIMPHESLYDIYDAVRLIENDAVSLLGLKIYRPGGGITSAIKMRTLSELYAIPCTVISCMELGVSTAASMQFASTIKKIDYSCEASGPVVLEDDVVKNPINIINGCAQVPKGVGIGVELDEAKLKKYSEEIIVCEESMRDTIF